jgi:hypothetical protein
MNWPWTKKPPAKSKVIGQAHQRDPLSVTADDNGPLAALSNDPITEAAYHQHPVEMAGAFGIEENTDGEEFVNLT